MPSAELIKAIQERIALGQSESEIEAAVLAMGHTKEVFDAAYQTAIGAVLTKESTPTTLPNVMTLFSHAFSAALERLDLVAFLALPLVLSTIASFLFGYDASGSDAPSLPLSLIFFAAGVAYFVALLYTLFVVTRQEGEVIAPQSASRWVIHNMLPLLSIYVLTALAIIGGFFFFFIPAIVVLIMVTFAQYEYVVEGKRGMAALLGSRALIKGRFATVAGKILGFALLSLLPAIALGIMSGLVETALGESEASFLITELLTQLLSALLTLVNVYAMFTLYQALKVGSGTTEPSRFINVCYWTLVMTAVSVFIVLFLMATLYKEAFTWIEDTEPSLDLGASGTSIPAEFSQLEETAEEFYAQNTSYQGVCAALTPLAEAAGTVTCNDSETKWALAVATSDGGLFCADTATPAKKIAVGIGEKTDCLAF